MDQIKICRICGDKANCFNFSGLPSCPPCRIFFQRHSAKHNKHKCLKQGKCEIDFATRKCCIKCRLDKCFEIGMVLKTREEKKKEKLTQLENEQTDSDSDNTKIPDNNNETSINSIIESNIRENICSDVDVDDDDNNDKNNGKNKWSKFKPKKKQIILPIPRSNRRLKRSLKLNHIETQQIDIIENAFKGFKEENQLPVAGEDNIFNFIANLSAVYSKRAIKFCKRIPIFASLSEEEKLLLLKPFCFEACLIRTAFFFDKDKIGFYALKDESGMEAVLIKVDIFKPQYAHLHAQNRQINIRLHDAMENDVRIRNMLIAIVLVKPFKDYQTCSESLRYQFFVYRHLFRRYLEAKYGSVQHAESKFNLLMNMIEKDVQIVKANCCSLLIDHGVDQVADLVAEVLSIKD